MAAAIAVAAKLTLIESATISRKVSKALNDASPFCRIRF
jgi:hypothetical protein